MRRKLLFMEVLFVVAFALLSYFIVLWIGSSWGVFLRIMEKDETMFAFNLFNHIVVFLLGPSIGMVVMGRVSVLRKYIVQFSKWKLLKIGVLCFVLSIVVQPLVYAIYYGNKYLIESTLPGDVVTLINNIESEREEMIKSYFMRGWRGLIWGIIGLVIVPPIAEEFFFRGVLLRYAKMLSGGLSASIFTSFVFALFHASPYQILPIFFLSLIISYYFVRSGSIVPGVFFHLGNNLSGFAIAYLYTSNKIDNFLS